MKYQQKKIIFAVKKVSCLLGWDGVGALFNGRSGVVSKELSRHPQNFHHLHFDPGGGENWSRC